MPIEVRELVIRAKVEESLPNPNTQNGAAHQQAGPRALNDKELDAIISACVSKVMSILKRQKVR